MSTRSIGSRRDMQDDVRADRLQIQKVSNLKYSLDLQQRTCEQRGGRILNPTL